MRPILFCGALVLFCLFLFARTTIAQVDEHKFEVGGVFTSITLSDFKARTLPGLATGDSTVQGIGGRIAYNFAENIALDAEGSFFPESHLGNDEFGQKLQGFVGVKAGIRKQHVGVFAKARPGVMSFAEFSTVGNCSATSFGSVCNVGAENDFAMDLGGVFEYYPTDRMIVRADVGDTIVRYSSRRFGSSVLSSETKNNFQISIGFGWRF
jgi:hypothetical protein